MQIHNSRQSSLPQADNLAVAVAHLLIRLVQDCAHQEKSL